MMESIESQCNVVPWHSKSEWNDVFEKIYSNDLKLQNEAFKKMSVWKIRCPKLPVGVECTMEILQVHLFSKKCGEIPFAHKDLQLMYSTTIMRFVNQLTHIYGKKMNMSLTCYKIAEICNIPDWIVNIRHEAAHSNLLPSIELLDLAAAFVLEWLYNNYWIPEAKDACDLVIKEIVLPDDTERKLKICLNLWQACKLYKYANYNTIGEIPNRSLRLHLSSLQKRKNILNDYDISSPENVFALTTLESYLINDGTCGKSVAKISAVLIFLNSYLTKLFPRNGISDYHSENVFIKTLIDCELFLPTTYDHTFYSDGHSLHGSLSSLWRDVLETFHKAQLLPNLIQKLAVISVEDNITSRQLVAACWISHLTESLCTPSDEIDIFVEMRENRKFASFFLQRDEYNVDVEKVRSRYVLRNLNLSKNIILNNHILENTVNKVTMSPNIYTIIFLPRLLDLLNPSLDQDAKCGIIQLVKAYTKTEECISTSDTIYTADMLFGSNLSESEEKCEISSQSKSIWSKQHGFCDWSKYPLGQLPQVL